MRGSSKCPFRPITKREIVRRTRIKKTLPALKFPLEGWEELARAMRQGIDDEMMRIFVECMQNTAQTPMTMSEAQLSNQQGVQHETVDSTKRA